MKRILLVLFCMFLLSEYNYSQKNKNNSSYEQDSVLYKKLEKKHQSGFFGVSFTNAVAQGELQSNFNRSDVGAGQGFSLYGGYSPEFFPINFGMDINFIFWSSDEKRSSYGGFPRYYDTLTASNNGIPINLYIQFKPEIINFISPYIEGFAGLTIYSSSLDFKSNYLTTNQNETKSDVSLNYGVGAGLMIKLGETIKLPDSRTSFMLDLKMRYNLGNKTDFRMRYLSSDGQILENNFNSKTDVVYFYAGFVFQF